MSYVSGTRPECDSVKVSRDKLLSKPERGEYVTAQGNVAVIPKTWDGEGAVPAGWTGYAGPEEHPERKGEWAVEVGDAETVAALNDAATASKLAPAEKTDLAAKVAAAVTKEAWLAVAEPVPEVPVDPKGDAVSVQK